MKRLSFIFALVILLAAGAMGAMSAPSYAQGYGGYNYPPPPQNPYSTPWVGNNTPWTYYQGDWFLNGILHNFFGNQNGWAPYYAYPPTYIVRPNDWYEPKWNTWYQGNPHYWKNFEQKYPYWRGHHAGQRYDQNFYNKYHRGHGKGWHQGFQRGKGADYRQGGRDGNWGKGGGGKGGHGSNLTRTGGGVKGGRGGDLNKGGGGGKGGHGSNLTRTGGGKGGGSKKGGGGGKGGGGKKGGH